MSEWLKVMIEEIDRKRADAEQTRTEEQRRDEEQRGAERRPREDDARGFAAREANHPRE